MSVLLDSYKYKTTGDVQRTLVSTSWVWLLSMPISASQLVILTAVEDKALIGTEAWARHLPLSATGPGEPFVTAASILAVMSIWRAFYAAYIDISAFMRVRGIESKEKEQESFVLSLFVVAGIAVSELLLLHHFQVSLLYKE